MCFQLRTNDLKILFASAINKIDKNKIQLNATLPSVRLKAKFPGFNFSLCEGGQIAQSLCNLVFSPVKWGR